MLSSRKKRGGKTTNVAKQVNNAVRRLHLNAEPTWHLARGRNNDPPPYNTDVAYVRKVRLTGTAATAIDPTIINSAVFGATEPFARMMVTRFEAWGPAAANSHLIVQPTDFAFQGNQGSGKTYSDFGTQGARRPHLVLTASPKDLAWVSTGVITSLFGINAGPNNTGQWIADLMVHFSNSAAIDPVLELAMNPPTPFRREHEEDTPASNSLDAIDFSIFKRASHTRL